MYLDKSHYYSYLFVRDVDSDDLIHLSPFNHPTRHRILQLSKQVGGGWRIWGKLAKGMTSYADLYRDIPLFIPRVYHIHLLVVCYSIGIIHYSSILDCTQLRFRRKSMVFPEVAKRGCKYNDVFIGIRSDGSGCIWFRKRLPNLWVIPWPRKKREAQKTEWWREMGIFQNHDFWMFLKFGASFCWDYKSILYCFKCLYYIIYIIEREKRLCFWLFAIVDVECSKMVHWKGWLETN